MSDISTMTLFPGCCPRSTTSCILCWAFLFVFGSQCITMAQPKLRVPEESQSEEGGSSGRRETETLAHSSRINARNNSPALNHFLEDVLEAQNELKWIDRAVHRSGSSREFGSKKSGERKTRREYSEDEEDHEEDAGDSYGPKRLYLDEEIKTKREVEGNENLTSGTAESLAELKRTVVELRNSLNPRECQSDGNEVGTSEGKRKLLWSQNVRSDAGGVVIEYYDYEENAEPLAVMNNREMQDENKREEPRISFSDFQPRPKIPKKDENSEEERKEDEELKKLKNKSPKIEFIGDLPSEQKEDTEESTKQQFRQSSNVRYDSQILKRIPSEVESESDIFDSYNKYKQLQSSPEENSKTIRDLETDRDQSLPADYENSQIIDFEPEVYDERSYLIISQDSPGIEKRSRKRSIAAVTESPIVVASAADKARSYMALKITDDMFKGGVEQSNPLNEDKPVVEGIENGSSSYSSSTFHDSQVDSMRSSNMKTTTEWKLSEETNRQPEKVFRRRLSEISEISHTNVSSSIDKEISNSSSSRSIPKSESIEKSKDSHNYDFGNFENFSTTLSPLFGNKNSEILNVGDSGLKNLSYNNNTRMKRRADAFETPEPHRKLTVLLAADNLEDESQIDLAVHGELAGKIVERIFEEVQRNEGLKVALGPGLYRKHKPQESMALDKMYRQGLDEDEIKETEAMMRRVMELLGRLVLDEVRRKTCATLAPDMKDFLQWSLGLEDETKSPSDQVPPLPTLLNNRQQTEHPQSSGDKFLFPTSSGSDSLQANDLTELQRKVTVLKSLINEYNALTEREKTKVQTVHDYLMRQLVLLMKYIESRETVSRSQKSETAGAKTPSNAQNILQYQGATPNLSRTPQSLFNVSHLKNHRRADSMINMGLPDFHYLNEKSQWTRKKRQEEDPSFPQDLHRVRREFPQNHKKIDDTEESPEHRKLLDRIATLRRRKREDPWGYEKPMIYSAPLDSQISTTLPQFASSNYSLNASIPIRFKNRQDDEVLLLNKREAWKKENVEELTFGKDTRNDFVSDRRKSQEIRLKRKFDEVSLSNFTTTTCSSSSTSQRPVSKQIDRNLRSIEKKINVFPVEIESGKIGVTRESSVTTAD